MSTNNTNVRFKRGNGFGTLVSKGVGKPWLAKWNFNGKTYYRTTGEVDKRKAYKKLEEFTRETRVESEVEALENITNKIQSIKNKNERDNDKKVGIFISDIDVRFEAEKIFTRDLTKSTIANYLNLISRFQKWMNENHPEIKEMKEVTKDVAMEYMSSVVDASAGLYNNSIIILNRIWNNFKDEAHIKNNPWNEIPKKKREKSMRKGLTVEEVSSLLNYTKEHYFNSYYILFLIGVYSGLRISDCAMLKWSEVDIANATINVIPQKTKKHTGVVSIPIHPTLFNELFDRWQNKGDNEYVIPILTSKYLKKSITNTIRRIFQECGIKTSEIIDGKKKYIAGFHSFRHTFVSMNINSGMSPLLIQKVVGHSAVDMTEHYFHANRNVIKDGISAMPNLLELNPEEKTINCNISRQTIEELKALFDEKTDTDLNDVIKRLIRTYKANENVIYV